MMHRPPTDIANARLRELCFALSWRGLDMLWGNRVTRGVGNFNENNENNENNETQSLQRLESDDK
jgi:hypothetical protein